MQVEIGEQHRLSRLLPQCRCKVTRERGRADAAFRAEETDCPCWPRPIAWLSFRLLLLSEDRAKQSFLQRGRSTAALHKVIVRTVPDCVDC